MINIYVDLCVEKKLIYKKKKLLATINNNFKIHKRRVIICTFNH